MLSPSERPASRVFLQDLGRDGLICITRDPSLSESAWYRIVEICGADARPSQPGAGDLVLSWTCALITVPQIAKLRSSFAFQLVPDATCEARFRTYQQDRQAVQAARAATRVAKLTDEELEKELQSRGFTRRQLKWFQKRDTEHLAALAHGANFSVPGAGKTTVALAVHTLTRRPNTALLVVAPKNAFAAWEETLLECLDGATPDGNGAPFVRLVGNESEIAGQLSSALKFLVTYERFARNTRVFASWFTRRPVHLILDESHRIKAGEFSQRGQAILGISALPVRRDILSGTPIPHDVTDLQAQLNFLWPGQKTGDDLHDAPPRLALRNLYVRTTKSQLGLRPPVRQFIRVPMAPCHAAFYGVLRDETLQQIAHIRHSQIDIVSARRSVIRLLQASTSPISTLNKIIGGDEPSPVATLASALLAEGESTKILKAADLVRETVAEGKKIVVWTIFTEALLRLEELLSELNPLLIYGATPTGDILSEETREGRVRLFHDSAEHNVLIANPAACSEGISLHRVCHEALYLDRSYNAAHYLQSVDRIHRIGLPEDVETRIRILQSAAPAGIGSIDYSVSRRLLKKMQVMTSILDDEDIRTMALDEEGAGEPVDDELTQDDLADLLEQLSSGAAPTADEQL